MRKTTSCRHRCLRPVRFKCNSEQPGVVNSRNYRTIMKDSSCSEDDITARAGQASFTAHLPCLAVVSGVGFFWKVWKGSKWDKRGSGQMLHQCPQVSLDSCETQHNQSLEQNVQYYQLYPPELIWRYAVTSFPGMKCRTPNHLLRTRSNLSVPIIWQQQSLAIVPLLS